MRIRWRNFELPSRVRLDNETSSDTYGRFTVEPFERGFGTTFGNRLRRVLLSSIEGTAVTSVKIDGVVHEYASIPGVLEDVTDMVRMVYGDRVIFHDGDEAIAPGVWVHHIGGHTDGLQVADVAAQQSPRVPVVLLTGRPSFGAAQSAIRTHVREIVAKP